MPISYAETDEMDQGFVIGHNVNKIKPGTHSGIDHIDYDGQEDTLADYWIGAGVIHFLRAITNDTINLVLIVTRGGFKDDRDP